LLQNTTATKRYLLAEAALVTRFKVAAVHW